MNADLALAWRDAVDWVTILGAARSASSDDPAKVTTVVDLYSLGKANGIERVTSVIRAHRSYQIRMSTLRADGPSRSVIDIFLSGTDGGDSPIATAVSGSAPTTTTGSHGGGGGWRMATMSQSVVPSVTTATATATPQRDRPPMPPYSVGGQTGFLTAVPDASELERGQTEFMTAVPDASELERGQTEFTTTVSDTPESKRGLRKSNSVQRREKTGFK